MPTATNDARVPAFKVRPNAVAELNDGALYALFVASVPEVDREGEVILPESFNTSEWERNPVWLWAHDQKDFPIGKGVAPDGSAACYPSKDALRLGCTFSQANPKGVLTYALYKEKTLKMVSVGFMSGGQQRLSKIEAAQLFGHDGPATLVLSPELVECSCVPIGMNRSAMIQSIKSWDGYADRDAVSSILDKGHIAGEKLTPEFRDMLAPFAAPRGFKAGAWPRKIPNLTLLRRKTSLDFPLARGTAMAAPKAPLTAGTVPDAVVKTPAAPAAKYDAKTQADVAAKVAAAVETKDMTTTNDTGGGELVKPAMVETLESGIEHMLAFCKAVSEATATTDLPDNLEYAKGLCGKVADLIGDMGEYGTKTYPDHTDLFTNAVGLADNFRVLAEENPDEANAGDGQEADLNDEAHDEKNGPGAADDAENPPKHDLGEEDETVDDGHQTKAEDDEDKDEKAAADVVTVKAFNEWYTKTFGETDAKETVTAWINELLDARIAPVERAVEQLGELV